MVFFLFFRVGLEDTIGTIAVKPYWKAEQTPWETKKSIPECEK